MHTSIINLSSGCFAGRKSRDLFQTANNRTHQVDARFRIIRADGGNNTHVKINIFLA